MKSGQKLTFSGSNERNAALIAAERDAAGIKTREAELQKTSACPSWSLGTRKRIAPGTAKFALEPLGRGLQAPEVRLVILNQLGDFRLELVLRAIKRTDRI